MVSVSPSSSKPIRISIAAFLLCLLLVGAAELVSAIIEEGSLPQAGGIDRSAESPATGAATSDDSMSGQASSARPVGARASSSPGDLVDATAVSGVADWWLTLPRQPRGWWITSALVDPEVLLDAEAYVRCEDLNPRDIPLSKAQLRHIADVADPLGADIKRYWKDRASAMHEEMVESVGSGALSERRPEDLAGLQKEVYASELRLFNKRGDDAKEVSRAERLALVNALGRTMGGFVHTARDGKVYAASLEELPRTELLDRAARNGKGELALWVIGALVEFGVLEVQEASKLADRSWKKLQLQ